MDTTQNDAARRGIIGRSVFAKIAVLIAVATLSVATVITALSVRMLTNNVHESVREFGTVMTRGAAADNAAAIRFGNTDAVTVSLGHITENSEQRAVALAAVNAAGDLLTQHGDAGIDELAELARAAVESGEAQVAGDGFTIAYPAEAGGVAVGAIAGHWSPDADIAKFHQAQIIQIAVALAVFAAMLGLSAIALRPIITRPLAQVGKVIDDLASGEYGTPVPHQSRGDEVGGIARNVENLKSRLSEAARLETAQKAAQVQQRKIVEQLSAALKTLASGDLTIQITEDMGSDYEAVRVDFNQTVSTMIDIIETVLVNSNAIKLNAEEISISSEDLSRRTENQAASLEETAASLDQITSAMRASAEGAREVEEIVRHAQTTAQQSDAVVQEAVGAMSTIEESSRQISQIIAVIDDIAFQTNLLALNAGVEAARAGEAGRGFAVVASEVRALAQRSSDAAREIKELITQSTQQVERGVDLVGRTGNELRSIIENVTNISEHIGTITASASEQSVSLAEINSGVTQLDQVTQQNAAMVEEATAASLTLREEAERLAESVGLFRLPHRSLATEAVPTRRAG
ncbi:HAMP domain-containing protein [Rhodobacterales bacterium HKCCE2091]|nr:HAMP domain-containing protein [Rhodobacterales bacterium HKCCE2091]